MTTKTRLLVPVKPRTVLAADALLVVWTLWVSFSGVYETLNMTPQLQAMIDEQLQGMIEISSQKIFEIALFSYGLIGLTLLWLIAKIDRGVAWARASLLLSFLVDLAWTCAPPYHELREYLSAVPDLGLQVLALYLLYTWPGRTWFTRDEWAVDSALEMPVVKTKKPDRLF